MAEKERSRIVWHEEDIMKMLPMVMASLEEGITLIKAVKLAQIILPKERQRTIIQEAAIPETLKIAVKVAQTKELKVTKDEGVRFFTPPREEEEKPFVCRKSGTGECPVEKQLTPAQVMGVWLSAAVSDGMRQVLTGPAAGLILAEIGGVLADAVSKAMDRHYMPVDPLVMANRNKGTVQSAPQEAPPTSESAAKVPDTPPADLPKILVLGLKPQYRDRLNSTFAHFFICKFWTSDQPTDQLLAKAKECNFIVANMNATSVGNVRILRSAAYEVEEIKCGADPCQDFITWIWQKKAALASKKVKAAAG